MSKSVLIEFRARANQNEIKVNYSKMADGMHLSPLQAIQITSLSQRKLSIDKLTHTRLKTYS